MLDAGQIKLFGPPQVFFESDDPFIKKFVPHAGQNYLEQSLKTKGVKLGNASVISVKLDVVEVTSFLRKKYLRCQLQAGETKLVYGFLQRKTK
jgi:tRNA threonylcarbamoyladenosine modification (KEOPS) complex Cgi121 subunit